jgi:hypothetical protein
MTANLTMDHRYTDCELLKPMHETYVRYLEDPEKFLASDSLTTQDKKND